MNQYSIEKKSKCELNKQPGSPNSILEFKVDLTENENDVALVMKKDQNVSNINDEDLEHQIWFIRLQSLYLVRDVTKML